VAATDIPLLTGRAVQVDPIKPTLKPPGTERFELNYEEQLSNFGFKYNLRRYILACPPPLSWASASRRRKIKKTFCA